MGALLTVQESVKNPKITGVFMLAIAITIYLHPRMIPNAFMVAFDKLPEGKIYYADMLNCYGLDQDKNILKCLTWIPRFTELFILSHRVRRLLGKFDTPCTAYQSLKDEVVLKRSVKYLKKHSKMTVKALADSGHYHYGPGDTEYILKEFAEFVDKMEK